MKNWLFGLASLVLAFPVLSHAAGLPESAHVDFRVINISMDNQDAESAGVRPGDVLRYEAELRSATDDVVDYTAQFDVSSIADHVEFIELGLGRLEGGWIVNDPKSFPAPARQVWTFFARFRGCEGSPGQLSVSLEGSSTLVPTHCDGAPVHTEETPVTRLPSSGPTKWFVVGFLSMVGIFCFGQLMMRRA